MAHVKGEYFEHHRKPFIFVHIPKNGSSTMKQHLLRAGYTRKEGGSDKNGFALIRNPYERYVSGVFEWWKNNVEDELFETWLQLQEHPVVNDEHTEPQASFLKDFSNIELQPLKRLDYVARVMTNTNYTFKMNASTAHMFHEYVDEDEIKKFYREDYKLWKQAKSKI